MRRKFKFCITAVPSKNTVKLLNQKVIQKFTWYLQNIHDSPMDTFCPYFNVDLPPEMSINVGKNFWK